MARSPREYGRAASIVNPAKIAAPRERQLICFTGRQVSQVEQGAQDLFSQGFNHRSHCCVVMSNHPLRDVSMFFVMHAFRSRLTPLAMKKE